MSTPGILLGRIEVEAATIRSLVASAGMVHPLFTGQDPPLPGQGLLLLVGGLAERSGHYDHAVALTGIDRVRFGSMVRAGTTLEVRDILRRRFSSASGTELEEHEWQVDTSRGRHVLSAVATFVVRDPAGQHHHSSTTR